MPEHYPNAACRHLADSKLLLNSCRWHGSAYLAGYAIECSLKALIVAPTPPPGVNVRAIGHDLSGLQACLSQMASARRGPRRRNVPSVLLSNLRSFLDAQQPAWKPELRYQSTDAAWKTQAAPWWEMAQRCFKGLAQPLATESDA